MLKVSVIIPVYNAELYIDKCIDTVCNQTMPLSDYEVIVIDDGSSDGSVKLINRAKDRYINIIIINQENQGASVARNAGLDIARGKYISFVDADDWIENSMLETLYNEAEQNKADMIFFNLFKNENEKMKPYLSNGVYSKKDIEEKIYPRLISSLDENLHGKTLRGATWCKFFRKKLIDDNSIRYHSALIYNEDAVFSIQATLASKIYVYLGDSYLYHNRVNSESITKRYIDNLWNRQKVMIMMLSNLNEAFDFSGQIDKKLFDIAIYSVENEIKKKNRKRFRERISEIHNIISDKDLQSRITNLPVKQFKKIERIYFFCIKFRLAVGAYMAAKYRYRNNKMF